MGHSISKDIDTFKDGVLKETHFITELAVLSYSDFVRKVKELNKICYETIDCNNRTLLFVIKGGSDSSILWKATVQVACVRLVKETNKMEDYKLLNLKHFLQAYKMIMYHIKPVTGGGSAAEQTSSQQEGDSNPGPLKKNSISTSMILNHIGPSDANDLDECIICMERKPELTLPCAHSYCLFCIEQWNVSNKTCPVCRDAVENTDDSWVLPDIPASDDVNAELQRTLTGLTSRFHD